MFSSLLLLVCFCGSSSAFHPLAPHESDFLHWTALVLCPSVSCVSVCVSLSRLSSDVLKGLMSGAQAALPPHLQLAFSGKRWPTPPAGCMRLLFVAFFIICQDALRTTTDHSLSLQMSIKRRAETCRGSPYDITQLPTVGWSSSDWLRPLLCMICWLSNDRNCFYTHLNSDAQNIMNNVLEIWVMMRQLYICINVYTDRPNHCGRGGKRVCVRVFACSLACSFCKWVFLMCRVIEYSWASECVPPSLM